MIAHIDARFFSPEEYLAFEETSPIKHEYYRGQIHAIAGASEVHVTIAGNIFAALRSYVRGSGCRVYIADMKTQIEAADCYYYPDVLVTCDPRDQPLTQCKKYPCLIVEVLSPGTEAVDRGNKFFNYQKLETLQEYVLISQNQQRVDLFRRDSSGFWVLQFYEPEEVIHLRSIDFKISFAQLYEDVDFSTLEPTDGQG